MLSMLPAISTAIDVNDDTGSINDNEDRPTWTMYHNVAVTQVSSPASKRTQQTEQHCQHPQQHIDVNKRSMQHKENHQPASHQKWSRLPAEMIQTIAASLDARSLARLESVDKFTHKATQSRSHSLWSALAAHSHTQAHAWLTQPQRYKLNKLETSPTTVEWRSTEPKAYVLQRWNMVREFHQRLVVTYHTRFKVEPLKRRVIAMRWYDEFILPILLFLLFTIFIILLIYQLQANNGSVTWLSMSFIVVICGLITLATCFMCFIRCRSHGSKAWLQQPSNELNDTEGTLRTLHEYRRDYDTKHYFPDDYVHESHSFINNFLNWIEFEQDPTRHVGHTFEVRSERQVMLNERRLYKCAFAGLLFTGLLLSLIFLCLRVTDSVTWSWSNVFAPFFVSVSLVCLIPCLPTNHDASLLHMATAMFIMILSPLVTFVAMLTVYLNNLDEHGQSSLRLHHVFIPLYVVDAMSFLGTIIPLLVGLIQWVNHQRHHDPGAELACFLGWIFVIAPFVWIEVTLGINADVGRKVIPYVFVFIPLLIPLVIGCVALTMVQVSQHDRLEEAEKKVKREHEEALTAIPVPFTVDLIEQDSRFIVQPDFRETDDDNPSMLYIGR